MLVIFEGLEVERYLVLVVLEYIWVEMIDREET